MPYPEPAFGSFGEYLDNPDVIEEDRLNANVGCIVERDWSQGLDDGLQYREIPRARYVIAEFTGAPSIGPQKVYPKAKKMLAENGYKTEGPVIEVYERFADGKFSTHYFFQIVQEHKQ